MADLFHQLTAFIISQLIVLLQLKYQTQTPFATLPTTMFVAVSSMLLYYLLYVSLLQSPLSPFAAPAKHLLVWSAYVAVSTLAAALFPQRATPFIYTIFGVLSAGQVLYMFRDKLAIKVEGEGEGDGDAWRFEVWRRCVCRLFKNMWCGVANFFVQQPPTILPI